MNEKSELKVIAYFLFFNAILFLLLPAVFAINSNILDGLLFLAMFFAATAGAVFLHRQSDTKTKD